MLSGSSPCVNAVSMHVLPVASYFAPQRRVPGYWSPEPRVPYRPADGGAVLVKFRLPTGRMTRYVTPFIQLWRASLVGKMDFST